MSKQETLDKWVPKPNAKKRSRAVVYDFDNTLFQSPGRETGEPAYLEGTGTRWPYSGWWGRLETLTPPIVPDPIPESMWITATLEAYLADRVRADTNCYLMTGRPAKTRHRVKEILATKGLVFDEYYFRGSANRPGHGDTLEIKLDNIRLDIIHPGLTVLEIWEDRPEHTSRFCDEAKRWRAGYGHLERVVVHDVLTGLHLEF